MSEPYLFAVAAQNAEWLSARQKLVATNVANANTPGYRATDLKPFINILERSGESLATTHPAHMMLDGNDRLQTRVMEPEPSDVTLSGNSVNLEREMTKLGEVNRSYSLNTNIQRTFHQMLMATLK